MKQFRFERFKLYVLMVLVLTSFIQVGILWNYQNEGLPTNFLWNIFDNSSSKVPGDVGDYVKLFRVTATEGYDESHFIINEDHEYYAKLCNEAFYYLTNLLEGKNILSKQTYPEEYWGEIVVKKSFVYEFRTKINISTLSALLNVENIANQEFDGIYKMALLPRIDSNNNIGLYVYDGNKTYGFVLPFNKKGLSREKYNDILIALENNETYSYVVMNEWMGINKTPYKIKPDILIPRGSASEDFEDIICSVPQILQNIDTSTKDDLEKIAAKVLGNDKERLTWGIDLDKSIVFRNPSKSYKIHKDGLLEYKYLSQYDRADKGAEIEALEKAIDFIAQMADMVKGADIYLSGINSDKDGYYTFTFDYKVNQKPVSFLEYPVNTGNESFVNNAITINANKKKVLSCYWIVKEFSVGNNTLKIRTYPFDLLDDVFKKYDYLNFSNFSVKDVIISYEGKYSEREEHLKPVWVIETIDGRYYTVEMKEKKGE
ncbi:hypothetical protein [Acetivibrio clariflavus]|uniref:Two-component signal transduction system YycFG, regulatory protein YycH n=1 Tax=Acetivibrio clariflavus (strain DSM 19732 / NBRC 101661 / EBR45) TaxID=720554 RepID=G8LUF4_ACECE|nr:hypothetical protein [Acetivibrio clariflavus]AEV70602.1 hypothetical protein Clocl_4172 [Acetivibrio clariflavus DSM 19732]